MSYSAQGYLYCILWDITPRKPFTTALAVDLTLVILTFILDSSLVPQSRFQTIDKPWMY